MPPTTRLSPRCLPVLQTLDTVIAFVVILTVVSLLITLIVQMLSTALSLRGKNLANALAVTFQTIDPDIKEDAHKLAEHILKDPIISDSLWKSKNRAAGSPVTGTRSAQWGFLSSPVAAWNLATAVRPGEVYRILHELGDPDKAKARRASATLITKAAGLLEALKGDDQPALEAKAKLRALKTMAEIFTTPEQKQAVVDSLASLGSTVERASTQAYDRFQRWFGSAQDRSEQWFQVHARGITVVSAFLLAFLLQLDTIAIFRQLRSQPELVAALVKAVPVIQADGQSALAPPVADGDDAALRAHRLAVNNLRADLDAAGFDLVPERFLGRWGDPRSGKLFDHFFGTLITAGLLTLGAPFWFNLLKNLMNLRPALATLIERRPQSAPALPQTPPAPVPAS